MDMQPIWIGMVSVTVFVISSSIEYLHTITCLKLIKFLHSWLGFNNGFINETMRYEFQISKVKLILYYFKVPFNKLF